jgi:hypothetical protein
MHVPPSAPAGSPIRAAEQTEINRTTMTNSHSGYNRWGTGRGRSEQHIHLPGIAAHPPQAVLEEQRRHHQAQANKTAKTLEGKQDTTKQGLAGQKQKQNEMNK